MLMLVLLAALLVVLIVMIVTRRWIGRLGSLATLIAGAMMALWLGQSGLLPGSVGPLTPTGRLYRVSTADRFGDRVNMKNVSRTQIAIAAPPEAVWSVPTDLPAYPTWNPFIRRAEGAASVGANWCLELTMNGRSFLMVRTRVTCCDPDRRLTWRGGIPVPGLLTGSHDFRIEPVSGGVRFVQEETFTGLLVPAFLPWLRARTQDQFDRMNVALRAEVDRRRGIVRGAALDSNGAR